MENVNKEKTIYLGDGLYVEDQDYRIMIFATDGISISNRVYLEPDMFVLATGTN